MQKDYTYHKLDNSLMLQSLQVIDSPPKQLFYIGKNPCKLLSGRKTATIVGSRKPTTYGREVTIQLARELTKKGVIIISGLALGVDSIAHRACLDAGGQTMAVLPCGPESIYPSSHRQLASRIIDGGGSLITEYSKGTPALRQNFIARNRLVSALGDVVIVTEAAEKSGTLHTANFALNQAKTVMAVPGPITSHLSRGTNNLIKAGAIPVTETADVLHQLGIDPSEPATITASTPEEQTILTLLAEGLRDGHQLLAASQLDPATFNQTLTMLEINGQVKPLGNNHWAIN